MNVVVTGGTGFVGRQVLRVLRENRHDVRILVRDPASSRVRELISGHAARACPGNVLDPASLSAPLEGVDAVIHLVGIVSEIGANTFENIHTRGTENVVHAAHQAGVTRFVHMSALGTRPQARSRYHQTKWEAEERVRESGLDWTIFRPSIIYGPGDGFVNLFARMSRLSPVLPVIGSGRTKFQVISVSDVASCFVKALVEPRSMGRTYDLCGTETLTLEEILDLILEITGRRRLKVHLPLWLARIQAACAEAVFPRLLRTAPPLNRDQLIMLQEDNVGDARPARELFGLSPGSFREGIAKYLS